MMTKRRTVLFLPVLLAILPLVMMAVPANAADSLNIDSIEIADTSLAPVNLATHEFHSFEPIVTTVRFTVSEDIETDFGVEFPIRARLELVFTSSQGDVIIRYVEDMFLQQPVTDRYRVRPLAINCLTHVEARRLTWVLDGFLDENALQLPRERRVGARLSIWKPGDGGPWQDTLIVPGTVKIIP